MRSPAAAALAWLRERYPVDAWADAVREGLTAPVPRTVGWAHVTGTVLAALLAVQLLTGLLLLADYRADPAAAYRSVQAIAFEVPLGWLVRGLHGWGATAIGLVALCHVAKALWVGAHKRPRELVWVTGALLLLTILALSFTGALLPYDQIAFWGTTVATEAPGSVPLAGPYLLHLVRGGDDVSGATLSRFFAAHVVALPAALAGLAAVHLALVRLHGVTPRASAAEEAALGYEAFTRGGEPFAPDHALREGIAVYAALALLFTLALALPLDLDAPADPLATPPGIRPAWYFLPFYQLLKYFPSRLGPIEGNFAGFLTVNALAALLVALPFVDRGPERRPRRRRGAIALYALGFAAAVALGALGHVAGRSYRVGGREVRFDIFGRPAVAEPAKGSGP